MPKLGSRAPRNIMNAEEAREHYVLDPQGMQLPERDPNRKYACLTPGRSGLLYRVNRQGPNAKAGSSAGFYNFNGYWYVKHRGVLYRADQIVTLLKTHGELPPGAPTKPRNERLHYQFAKLAEDDLRAWRKAARALMELADKVVANAETAGRAEQVAEIAAHAAKMKSLLGRTTPLNTADQLHNAEVEMRIAESARMEGVSVEEYKAQNSTLETS